MRTSLFQFAFQVDADEAARITQSAFDVLRSELPEYVFRKYRWFPRLRVFKKTVTALAPDNSARLGAASDPWAWTIAPSTHEPGRLTIPICLETGVPRKHMVRTLLEQVSELSPRFVGGAVICETGGHPRALQTPSWYGHKLYFAKFVHHVIARPEVLPKDDALIYIPRHNGTWVLVDREPEEIVSESYRDEFIRLNQLLFDSIDAQDVTYGNRCVVLNGVEGFRGGGFDVRPRDGDYPLTADFAERVRAIPEQYERIAAARVIFPTYQRAEENRAVLEANGVPEIWVEGEHWKYPTRFKDADPDGPEYFQIGLDMDRRHVGGERVVVRDGIAWVWFNLRAGESLTPDQYETLDEVAGADDIHDVRALFFEDGLAEAHLSPLTERGYSAWELQPDGRYLKYTPNMLKDTSNDPSDASTDPDTFIPSGPPTTRTFAGKQVFVTDGIAWITYNLLTGEALTESDYTTLANLAAEPDITDVRALFSFDDVAATHAPELERRGYSAWGLMPQGGGFRRVRG